MNKNIFIVGGNSGIGLELVKRLKNSRNNLYITSRNDSNLKDIEGIKYMPFDASKESEKLSLIPESIDGLVYLPGTINLKPFNRLKLEEFENDWRINFLGAVNVIQQLFNSLKKGENPSIVLVSTIAVQTGLNFHSSISSAKGAVEGLVKALAAEFAPTIRVNAIAPSLTDTPLAERLLNSEAKTQASAERHPLKRVGSAEDQVNAIEFLLSEKSSWITGQILAVDGGMSALR
jgi:NAD(P)-dependent dehydrogenase (short-subunit alcohol dehydrogenase family)